MHRRTIVLAIILSICHAISYHYTTDLSNAPFVA